MKQLDPRKTESALLKKGFVKDDRHHHYYNFIVDDRVVARTRMSHNDQVINSYLIAQMARQCQLKKGEFIDLISCPLSREAYEEILKTRRQ